jgi:secreted trypsin-like serine protease
MPSRDREERRGKVRGLLAFSLVAALAASGAGSQVLGGKKASPGELPYVAAIAINSGPPIGRSYFCGGTIVAARWVLTAAHCMVAANGQHRPIDMLEVTAGVLRLSRAEHQNHYKVAEAIVHPGYDRRSQANDIALLRLDRDWTGPTALLPSASDHDFAGTVTVAGFGATAEDQALSVGRTRKGERVGVMSDNLMAAELFISPLTECSAHYKKLAGEPAFDGLAVGDANICASSANVRDACQGDSGGPLLSKEGAYMVQVGIVSFGYGCAVPGYEGVYTRVSAFTGWIAKQIGERPAR